jgi:septum formation protein
MLTRVGVPIEVRPADVDETPLPGEDPRAYVSRIARLKASSVTRAPGQWVLAADTTVTIDGVILAKAEDDAEATAMLERLAGRTHDCATAYALVGESGLHEGIAITEVDFVPMSASDIAGYVASGEWRGKAGAYAIQGIAAAFVNAVRGSVTNVIGLPLAEVLALLVRAGAPGPRYAAGNPV